MRPHIDTTFAALSDPTRRAILARLAQGEGSVNALAEPFLSKMSLPAITKHIKVLEKAGLIIKGQDKQFRPCRLNAPALKEAADWFDIYRAHWEDSFDRLEAYLKTVTVKGTDDDQKT